MEQKNTGKFLLEIYRRLLERYGPQGWWPGDGAFEVCVGAILTQNTAWSNVEKAMARLKKAGCLSTSGLHSLPETELAELIHPSGYFNAKARKLKAFVAHLYDWYNSDLAALLAKTPAEALREELLSIYGIGEETADDIVLYAAGRPSFVVDAYTRRIVDRLGLHLGAVRQEPAEGQYPKQKSYASYRALFMDALPPDTALYNEYHALLVRLGNEVCRKQDPHCSDCPLQEVCKTGWAGVRKTSF